MNPTLVLLLLILALMLPVVGAAMLRLLIPRLSAWQFYGGAALIFAVAVASVLLLSRSEISDVQVAGLTLVLPVTGLDNSEIDMVANSLLPAEDAALAAPVNPDAVAPAAMPTEASAPVQTTGVAVEPTAAPEPTAVPTEIVEPTAEPTAELTAAPTDTPEPEPTAVPTEPPPPAPAEQRTYIVAKGDTLRSIAAKFDVTVDDLLRVNDLTPKQGDSLRIDQELIIP